MIAHTAAQTAPPLLTDAGTPIYDELLAQHPGLFDRGHDCVSALARRNGALDEQQLDMEDASQVVGPDTVEIPRVVSATSPSFPCIVSSRSPLVPTSEASTNPWFTPRLPVGAAA